MVRRGPNRLKVLRGARNEENTKKIHDVVESIRFK